MALREARHAYTPKTTLGMSNEKRFLTVRNYNDSDLSGGFFYGMVMAVSQNEFSAPPAAYRSASATLIKYGTIMESIQGELVAIEDTRQQQRQRVVKAQKAKMEELARARRESVQRAQAAEARQVIAQFQAGYAKDAVASSDASFLQEYGEATKRFYQSLTKEKNVDTKLYEPLRETAIVQLVRATTIRAKAGALEASGELLKSSLWWSEGR